MQILNLGSRHAGLENDIHALVEELKDPVRIQAAFPTLDAAAVLQRLADLPYVILVGPGMLTTTARVFHCDPGSDLSQADPLFSLLHEAETAPEQDDNEPRLDEQRRESGGFDIDYRSPCDGDSICNTSVGSGNVRPRWAGGTPGTAAIVIDCYGMYLPSLRKWLDGVCNELPASARRLTAGLADGPAVALCPETLAELPEVLMRSAALHVRRSLSPAGALSQLLVKLTLYHEIGHHVFPVRGSREDCPADCKYLSEALANWFVYCVIDARERAVLLEKSATQSSEYRAYRGLVWLEHAATDIVAVSGLDGPGWVGAIEKASFNNQLLGPVIDDEIDLRSGSSMCELDDLAFELAHILHHPRIWERLLRRVPLAANHAARAYGLLLMRAAAPRHAARLRHLEHELRHFGELRLLLAGAPISIARQRAWLDRAAEFPRRLPV